MPNAFIECAVRVVRKNNIVQAGNRAPVEGLRSCRKLTEFPARIAAGYLEGEKFKQLCTSLLRAMLAAEFAIEVGPELLQDV